MANESQHNWNHSFPGSGDDYKAFGKDAALSANSEKKASTLREWYRIGQAYFRGFLDHSKHVDQLNDALQLLSKKGYNEREGFLMGWQSDVYAYENGLEFSVEGTENHRDEEQDYGYIVEDEGRDVLDGPGFAR